MAAIWKFPLDHKSGIQQVVAPGLGKAVFFAMQDGQFHVWAKVKPGEVDVHRKFQVCATGEEIPHHWRHVGSLQAGGFVWHLFQEGM
jgi:hypothetical protein